MEVPDLVARAVVAMLDELDRDVARYRRWTRQPGTQVIWKLPGSGPAPRSGGGVRPGPGHLGVRGAGARAGRGVRTGFAVGLRIARRPAGQHPDQGQGQL